MRKHTVRHRQHHNNSNNFQDDMETIRDAFSEAARNAKGRAANTISDAVDNVRERGTEVRDDVADYVAEKPYRSMGVMLLSGILIGAGTILGFAFGGNHTHRRRR